MVGEQCLEVIKVKFDRCLAFQVGITFGDIPFVHAVYYLYAVDGKFGAENFDPQEWLYG